MFGRGRAGEMGHWNLVVREKQMKTQGDTLHSNENQISQIMLKCCISFYKSRVCKTVVSYKVPKKRKGFPQKT
jgi:hypothetical protein